MSDSAVPWTATRQASLSFTISQSLLKLMSIESVMPGHPTSSSSVVPFSSCLQSFPAARSFQMCQLFTSGGQSIGASASASVLPVNQFNSVQFSRSVMSNSFRPHESQHTRPPCPSPTPRVHSNSCPSSR